jgi:4-diphosphocytidyl-2-C-methyl-D-erythritol kinase
MSVTLPARAKINLWLHVFPPDSTGYHPLDTLFCAIDLADEITIDLAVEQLQVDVAGADLGPVHDNLAYRAAREFFLATGLPERASIALNKRIPAGAGLGGGSSDAAAVLRGLNELHGDVLSSDDLMAMGARLGSDVAFFLSHAALAHATGRGEVLRALPPLPQRYVLIVVPDFAISTADAYRWLDDAKHYSHATERETIPRDWSGVAARARNDFEAVVFRKHASLAQVKAALRGAGAITALLSGSGSTVFGIYADQEQCRNAQEQLRKAMPRASLQVTATCF